MEARIDVNSQAQPHFCKTRPVPFAPKHKVEAELDKLQKEGIVEAVQSAKWAAPQTHFQIPLHTSVRFPEVQVSAAAGESSASLGGSFGASFNCISQIRLSDPLRACEKLSCSQNDLPEPQQGSNTLCSSQ